ncbi:hypothetical protein DKX38_002990 [Salix brachista]|uniref:Reverse transcriptase/retrotransposon-derived protein RNase H-like domain-containing protein n=1 Tax=Salix brachista TaxID=2182728 RepID=A0A5N5NQ71_9ROSI|nr:hypothetical protein DKX38_002990 [Salix brachista]
MKISTVVNWPIPTNTKAIRGFLSLTGYYRKFVKVYENVGAPLTTLLKKNSFNWTKEATQAFVAFKTTMITPSVLGLPNFTKSFVVECNALGCGIGVVLMQERQP